MILALESATAACSAAVFDAGGQLVAETPASPGPAHSQELLPGVQAVLSQAGLDGAALEAIVVGLGPGAYTGLRIGVTTARALAQAWGVALVGVPTLEALALALADDERGAGAAHLVPLIDGRRGEVFAAVYVAVTPSQGREGANAGDCAGTYALVAPGVRLVESLSVVPADGLVAFLERYPGAVVGGDGAVLYAERLPPSARRDHAVAGPTAAMVGRCWLAGSPDACVGLGEVLPLYGRAPDARRWQPGERR